MSEGGDNDTSVLLSVDMGVVGVLVQPSVVVEKVMEEVDVEGVPGVEQSPVSSRVANFGNATEQNLWIFWCLVTGRLPETWGNRSSKVQLPW